MKCDICGKKVDLEQEVKEYPNYWKSMGYWSINASVIGNANIMKGHRICLQNVDSKIVIPERIKFYYLMKEVKEKVV